MIKVFSQYIIMESRDVEFCIFWLDVRPMGRGIPCLNPMIRKFVYNSHYGLCSLSYYFNLVILTLLIMCTGHGFNEILLFDCFIYFMSLNAFTPSYLLIITCYINFRKHFEKVFSHESYYQS